MPSIIIILTAKFFVIVKKMPGLIRIFSNNGLIKSGTILIETVLIETEFLFWFWTKTLYMCKLVWKK